MIPREVVEEVLSRVDMERLVGQRVTLRRSGQALKGLCPFHAEKTPSFTVSPRRGTFHCFGCGAGGDGAGFLMKLDGLSFPEAVAELAQQAGYDLPAQSEQEAQEAREKARQRAQYLDIMARAAKLWQGALWGPQGESARAYLAARGVSEAQARRWGLGYAPQGLCAKMDAAGVSREAQAQSGLVVLHEDGGRSERFRGRLVFPVRDPWGRVLGFSGRLLDDDAKAAKYVKYVNSPETPWYKKGEILLGLDLAAEAIRRRGFALLVEGNFDALAGERAECGAVAPCGTALTAGQARALARLTDTVVVAFDGDKAGREAAQRAVGVLDAAGLRVKVATLPAGQDPATMDPRDLDGLVTVAEAGMAFLVGCKIDPALGLPLEDRVAAKDAALEVVAGLKDENLRRFYASMIGARLGLNVPTPHQKMVREAEPKAEAVRRFDGLELRMVRLLAQSPTWHREFMEAGLVQLLQEEALVVFVEIAAACKRRGGWRAAAIEAQDAVGSPWPGLADDLCAIVARAEAEPLRGDSFAGAVVMLAERYIASQRRLAIQATGEMRSKAFVALDALQADVWENVEWVCEPWKEGRVPVEPVEDEPSQEIGAAQDVSGAQGLVGAQDGGTGLAGDAASQGGAQVVEAGGVDVVPDGPAAVPAQALAPVVALVAPPMVLVRQEAARDGGAAQGGRAEGQDGSEAGRVVGGAFPVPQGGGVVHDALAWAPWAKRWDQGGTTAQKGLRVVDGGRAASGGAARAGPAR